MNQRQLIAKLRETTPHVPELNAKFLLEKLLDLAEEQAEKIEGLEARVEALESHRDD